MHDSLPLFVDKIENWSAEDVNDWIAGLEDSLVPYRARLKAAGINGRRLMMLTSNDLLDMNVAQLAARNSLLYSIELLMKLCYNLDSENLQTLAMQLSVRCRNLHNDLKRVSPVGSPTPKTWTPDKLPDRVHILLEISCLAEDTKRIISWLDRNPFNFTSYYRTFRNSVLHVVVQIIQLTQNGSKDILENLKNIQMLCTELCTICDRLVEEAKDPLVVQTAYLRKVFLRKLRSADDWGIRLESPYRGVHLVSSIRFQSPSDVSGKVNIGDEIVEIDDQVVVGWQRKCLLALLKSKEHRVSFVLKKHPDNTCTVPKNFTQKSKFLTVDLSRTKRRRERRRSASVMLMPLPLDGYGQNVDLPQESATGLASKNHSSSNSNVNNEDSDALCLISKNSTRRRATISVGDPARKLKHGSSLSVISVKEFSLPEVIIDSGSTKYDPLIKDMEKLDFNVPLESEVYVLPSFGGQETMDADGSTAKQPANSETDLSRGFLSCNDCTDSFSTVEVADSEILQKSGIPIDFSSNEWLSPKSAFSFDSLTDSLFEDSSSTSFPAIGGAEAAANAVHTGKYYMHSASDCLDHHAEMKRQNNDIQNLTFPFSYDVDLMASGFSTLPCRSRQKLRKFFGESFSLSNNLTGSSELFTSFDAKSKEIPCRSLGKTDHCGWAYISTSGHRGFRQHWMKRWIVLKDSFLYVYSSAEDAKPSNVITLTGLTVSPSGPDLFTTKPNVFFVKGPKFQIHFSCDHSHDMITWLNKMGLAAIGYEEQSALSKF